ncbi:hypothetical protein BGZ63DRAFT_91392 [Mariannaea sp. PMI_226]|nr:hypothetical protein BGZ63DRAFT_91392 [Mariannaea sp. PMI_226]
MHDSHLTRRAYPVARKRDQGEQSSPQVQFVLTQTTHLVLAYFCSSHVVGEKEVRIGQSPSILFSLPDFFFLFQTYSKSKPRRNLPVPAPGRLVHLNYHRVSPQLTNATDVVSEKRHFPFHPLLLIRLFVLLHDGPTPALRCQRLYVTVAFSQESRPSPPLPSPGISSCRWIMSKPEERGAGWYGTAWYGLLPGPARSRLGFVWNSDASLPQRCTQNWMFVGDAYGTASGKMTYQTNACQF